MRLDGGHHLPGPRFTLALTLDDERPVIIEIGSMGARWFGRAQVLLRQATETIDGSSEGLYRDASVARSRLPRPRRRENSRTADDMFAGSFFARYI